VECLRPYFPFGILTPRSPEGDGALSHSDWGGPRLNAFGAWEKIGVGVESCRGRPRRRSRHKTAARRRPFKALRQIISGEKLFQ
jgi:hypothetical protein